MHRFWTGSFTIAVLFAASGCDAAPEPPPYQPVLTAQELMLDFLEPAADGLWDSVGWFITEEGEEFVRPQDEETWHHVRHTAVVIMEGGNLLMMGDRAVDDGDWMTYSRELVEVGQKALAAAQSEDPQRVFDVGGEVYAACVNCHVQYWVEGGDADAGSAP